MASTTTGTAPPAENTSGRSRRSATVIWLLIAALALAAFTWLWWGYRWLAWPQPGFIDSVFHYDGALVGDWHTSLPPVHWAMAHIYGLVPFSALKPVIAVSWVAYLMLLWGAFVVLCQGLGASRWTAVAATALAVATGLAGVGTSGTVLPVFYPPAVSFALVVAAIAAIVYRRPVVAAALLGCATLVHSNQGALAAIVCALPIAVLLGRDLRRWAWAAVAFAVPALPSVIQAALGQTSGSSLDATQRYDLFAIVIVPIHLLWSDFTMAEYVQTALWTGIAIVAICTVVAKRLRVLLALLVASVGFLLAIGAIAGQAGGPALLVLLQTSRLSSLLIVLGVAGGAALAERVFGRWAPAALVLALLCGIYGERWWTNLAPRVIPGQVSWVTVNAACAIAVIVIVGLGAALPVRWRRGRTGAVAVAGVLAAVALAVVVGQRDGRVVKETPQESAYADIGAVARRVSAPGTIVLTPPDRYGFRDVSRRPIVVEFGINRYGKGDGEWVRRMNTVTGNDPAVLGVKPFGANVYARIAAIASAYDRAAESPTAACRYDAKLVVTRTPTAEPAWLEPVYANDIYRLSRVRPGTCTGVR